MSWRPRARELGRELSRRPMRIKLTDIFGGAAGALSSRDRFDDDAAGQFWIEGDFGALQRGVHEGNDFGIVEQGFRVGKR